MVNQKEKIKDLVGELRKTLDEITVKELADDFELQEELSELPGIISGFFSMLNQHKKALIMKRALRKG